jgi:hypothetical protein
MSNLDKLMQMATLEQLNNMVQQLNKTNVEMKSEAKDVLSLPIVQKVIIAYEDELKSVNEELSNSCKCVDNTDLIHKIFDHVMQYNWNLQRIETKIDNLSTLFKHILKHLIIYLSLLLKTIHKLN